VPARCNSIGPSTASEGDQKQIDVLPADGGDPLNVAAH
jgi:hypothetical protein